MARTRRKLLIIDGYNVLRSGERYLHLRDAGPDPDFADDAFNRAREALINDVVMYAGGDAEAVIVFDGNHEPPGDAGEKVAGVRIVFSTAGSSADRVIEKLSRDARDRGIEVMVVTSDATVQNTVFGFGVDRMSANGFSRAVARDEHERSLDEAPGIAVKNTVAERLSPGMAEKLAALRDSLGAAGGGSPRGTA